MTSSFAKNTTFLPVFKLKRSDLFKISLDTFPKLQDGKKFQSTFDGFFVEVHDEEAIKEIFNSGCFGKGSNSRSTPAILRSDREPDNNPLKVPETLILSHEEAFFLSYYLEVLEIKDSEQKILTANELFREFNELNSGFTRRIIAYIYLKSKNWIIRDGAKFGGDFLLYKKSIRIFHASFIVHVISENESKSQKDLQGHHRTAENAAKDLLYLTVHPPKDGETIDSLHKFKVTELIVRRFNFVSFRTK